MVVYSLSMANASSVKGDGYNRMYFDDSPKRIYDQARLMANANITLIGSEDMPSPSEDWLDSWDKYGLMNWHVFYQCYRMFRDVTTSIILSTMT